MESMSGEVTGLPVDLSPRGGMLPFGDTRLARLVAQGDRRALETIYRRHHQELYRYCRAILGDPHDAEDALQATMAKVAAALPGETREISLRPWLFRIAHNESISILRTRRPTAELDQETPGHADVELQAENRDRLRQLVRDLDRLPDRQRGALVMRELSDLTFDDLGAALGISPAAAKQAVYEARVALHEMSAGREMDCGSVRLAISDGDRRRLRGRRFRAHLRDCDGCAGFAAAIDRRRSDLAALAPPIALPAALGLFHAAVGAGTTGAAAGGAAGAGSATGIGAALGGSAAVKSAAAVIAAVAIAGGGVELGGLIDHNGGDRAGRAAEAAPAGADRSAAQEPTIAPASLPAAQSTGTGEERGGGERDARGAKSGGRGHDHGNHGGPAAAAEHSASGAGSSPPGLTGSPPGQASTPPGQASTPPGQAAAHGQGAITPESSSHSNTQAATHSSSAVHSQAASAVQRGDIAIATGEAVATGHSASGNAYGQTDKDQPAE
jgi:RNA polymerase sigma factor (sigma-70 family)